MTLHWWQHWFWITGRPPVVALLLAACHVWGQQPPWGHPGPGQPGLHPGPEDAADAALPQWWVPVHAAEVPVALHVPVDGPPPGWYPWAPRRLLGFAAAGDATAMPPSTEASAAAAASAAAPVAVSYLTTLGPVLGAATASSSQASATASASRAREAKAIGVLPVGVMPTVVRAVPTAGTPPPSRPPGTATSVLEIVEDLAEAATASPSENAPTSPAPASDASQSPTATENEAGILAASAEMANDEPAKAVATSSAEASPTEASEAVASSPGAASTVPTRMQSMSLSTAPTQRAAASDVTATVPAASSSDSAATAAAKADLNPPPRPSTDAVAHPAVSVPRRVATTPVASAATSAAPTTPSWSSASTAPPAAPHSHRAAGPLGASPGTSRQHAMSLSSGGGLDAGSITGIVLGIVVFAGLVGTVSFILYRRRYLNKPQTLNDKCSNPDSSGYIDDSTFRENSEEMYSLDNDSFLNSLEAMTIQNYWTDTVKHTKL